MRCVHCGSNNVDAFITVRMSVDADDYMHLTKQVIAKRTTTIEAIETERTNFVCRDCGHYF